jgi:dephospho-CoA kinase
VISGDEAGHEALLQPELRSRIVQRWGPGILDSSGAIERRKLGKIVFADQEQRRELEEIVFPWIKARLQECIEQAQADPQVQLIVLDAAVMLEAGWGTKCDRIVFVDAPPEVRLERVQRQRGWTQQELAARELAQLPLQAKAARADFVLDNSGSQEQLLRQVDHLLEVLNESSHG